MNPFAKYDPYDIDDLLDCIVTKTVRVPIVGFMLADHAEPRVEWWREFREYIADRAENELEQCEEELHPNFSE